MHLSVKKGLENMLHVIFKHEVLSCHTREDLGYLHIWGIRIALPMHIPSSRLLSYDILLQQTNLENIYSDQ